MARQSCRVRLDEFLVGQPLAHHLRHGVPHLVDGVPIPHVRTSREFVDVPLQMLRRQLVERAHVGAFQRSPERLDTVGVRPVCALPLTYSPTEWFTVLCVRFGMFS